jgi:O-antigen/teichoic acid export membrane protein
MISKTLSAIVLQRSWQALAGLVTMLLVTVTLTPELQGWYYTFISIASLYALFEMGLSTVLIQSVAHMFIELQWLDDGKLSGKSAFIFHSFLSKSFRVYIKLALTFLLVAGVIGALVFGYKKTIDITPYQWVPPWILLVISTSFNMITLPFFAVIEGSGEIKDAFILRFYQGFFGSILCWLLLLLDFGLWGSIAIPLVSPIIFLVWIVLKKSDLLFNALKNDSELYFDWKANVWPLQWRVGLGSITSFLMSQLSVPILFHYQGAVIAGKMGVSLSIAHMIGILSQSWIVQHVPSMSQAVARSEWKLLDNLFKRNLLRLIFTFLIGAILSLFAFELISGSSYQQRLLSIDDYICLLFFVFFYQINGALASQLRSYKEEPLVWIFLIGSLLALGGAFLTVKNYSAHGIVLVMLFVQAILIFPASLIVWKLCNRRWRMNN